MSKVSLNLNESSLIAYNHFQDRVNREGHLFGSLDGSIIVFSNELDKVPYETRSMLLPFHINYFTFSTLLDQLDGRRDLTIVETGTSANLVDSTTLWDSWIRKFGGKLTTIDIDPSRKLIGQSKWCSQTESIVSDSANYLNNWNIHHPRQTIDVVYLDSWDVDWYNPTACQEHGLKEFQAIIPFLSNQAWILIDDTPKDPSWLPERGLIYQYISTNVYTFRDPIPGKGALVLKMIERDHRFRIVLHQYQLLLEYNASGFSV
jgi:hypothetical protein